MKKMYRYQLVWKGACPNCERDMGAGDWKYSILEDYVVTLGWCCTDCFGHENLKLLAAQELMK